MANWCRVKLEQTYVDVDLDRVVAVSKYHGGMQLHFGPPTATRDVWLDGDQYETTVQRRLFNTAGAAGPIADRLMELGFEQAAAVVLKEFGGG